MQHLYTGYSETYSLLRNVFARLQQSVLANSLRIVILLFVLALSCGAWGESFVLDYSTASITHSLFPLTTAQLQYEYKDNANVATWKLIKFEKNTSIEFANITGATISAIKFEGLADNNSNKSAIISVSVGNKQVQTGSGSWNNRKSSTSLSSQTINSSKLKDIPEINAKGAKISVSANYTLGLRITITYTPASPASCTTFTYHFGTDGQSDWQQECFVYEEGTTDTYYIKNYTIPNKPNYYVGWQGQWNDGTNTDWKSANVGLSTMPFALQRSKTLGQIENGNNVGAVGTLRIYGNSKDDNKYIGFIPGGYVLRLGNGSTWTSSALTAITNNIDETVWTTETTTLTESLINGNYYVALKTADGFVWSPNKSADSKVLGIMGQRNGADSWGNNLNTDDVGKRGFFRIWADNDANNFCCHFVPVYRIVYKANYPTGTAPADTYSADVSVEETKTITLAGAPAAPNGYVFSGWTLAQDGSGNVLASDTEYTLTQPQNDVVLYAQWEKETILYTDTYIWKKQSDATGCVVNPNVAPNANQAYTEKTYSSSTIGGGSSMGRPDNVGEYSITIAAQSGYLIQSICTYGKVETASQISWDNGLTWTDLSTYTEQKKVFTAPTGGAESFIIKCTTTKSDSSGIWWRNALVTLINGLVCTPLTTFAWDVPLATYTYGELFAAPQLSVQSGISGTILYASSDVSVATIAPDGTLSPKMPGTTTISATYEGDDFCPTTVTYTLHVVCNATAPKIVSDGTETTIGCAQTITLHAVQSTNETDYTTGTFQWYRDGEVLSESTASTIEVRVPGNYTVAYNNGVCSVMSTNAAEVTASGLVPEVTRLARYQYFRVSGAYLESQKTRHLFRVKPTATGTPCQITVKAVRNNKETDVTGLANVMDYISFVDNNDGTCDVMLDLNKLQTIGAITGTLSEGDTLVFSCAPAACTENTFDDAYAKSIDVRVLGADKKALAFIVSGAKGEGSKDKKNHVVGGDFIDGVNKADLYLQTGQNTMDRTKELPLLTTLKKTYHVDPVNGYAAFDPMNYEPYDLIVFTDFPQASKSAEAAKNLDAIGNMVDVRPMLSLKAHMVRENLPNGVWKTQKGFIDNAMVPNPKEQTVMSILCYAHSMFVGFDSKKLSNGTTWTQADSTNALTNIMVDKDQNIYIRMFTKAGFENKKSLQGFTTVASENFVNIGTVPDATYTSLIACCERQANLEARLMMLAINSHTTSLLTEVGMKAIERILTYLLVTDPTKVSDCSIIFDNGYNADGTPRTGCTKHDGLWNTQENWNTGLVPLSTQNVQIKADVKVVGQATAANIKIQPTKKLTIAPDGALSANGVIGWLDQNNNATISAITDPTIITVQADENNTGALIQSDKEGKTRATIQMYSRATGTDKGNGMVENAVWQWITTPYNDVVHAVNTYHGAWLYTYNNSTHSWQQILDQSSVPPFAGYSITQAQAKTYTMTGTLVSTADQTISLSNGINLIGNSWTAPINISQFKVEDFVNAEATIVMFNTGLDPNGSGAIYTDENNASPNTYVSIPVNAAIAIEKLKVIPAMQAFQVKATADGATLTLDYDRLVHTKQVGNSPMRAPKHNVQTLGNGINERLRISVIGKRYSDYLYLLSHEEATEGFDNGWDGEKIYSDNHNVPVIYVENAAGDWQISTQPVLAGTQFGFYRGEDEVYTICFDYVGDKTLYFYDAVADTYTEVKTGFTFAP